jgi:RNA polymerase sigma-32 factor
MKRTRKGQSNLLPPRQPVTIRPESNSLPVVRDPLKAYIAEISKYKLMSKAEEARVIRKMQNGDIDAAKALVMANLRLVVKIAFEYKSVYQNVMDLIQEGNIGLMKAVSMYDPKFGAKLSYYASWWIRSYILKFLIDNFRLVKIGTTQAQKRLFYNLIQEQRKLENQGLLALPDSISKDLGVSQKDVLEMSARLLGNAEVSMEQPLNTDSPDERSFSDLYQDNSTRPDLIAEEKQEHLLLAEKLKEISLSLNDKEKVILKDRLLSDTPSTLQEIADKFGISKERTRQLEERILKRLRQELSEFRPEN